MAIRSKRRVRTVIKRISKILLVIIVLASVIFHRYIIDLADMLYYDHQVKKGEKGLTYSEIHLTKEQMLSDYDYLYKNACTDTLSKDEAEKYLDLDYDEVYENFRSRIENCSDEYEFVAVMFSLMSRMPGVHNDFSPPSNDLSSAEDFFLSWNIGRKDVRECNYCFWKQFEDRMWSYDQKGIVAVHRGNDYFILPEDIGNPRIEGLDFGKIITLNGVPVQTAVRDIDVIHHWGYDEHTGCVRVPQLFFNDSIGDKYEAEIEMPDGSLVKKDLYVSAEYNLAMQFREDLYPDHSQTTDESDSSDESNKPKKSYSIEKDEDRKLIYANIPKCLSEETASFYKDMTSELDSSDADTIILDFKNNGGGTYSFVTDGVGKAVFDGKAGWVNEARMPKTDLTKLFYDNKIISLISDIKKEQDSIIVSEDFSVDGKAKKKYDIYLLVTRNTFSSGDIFAQIAAAEDNVTVIGENTSGEGLSGVILTYYLPESKMPFNISTGVSLREPDDNYLGVIPDIYCAVNRDDIYKKFQLYSDPDIGDRINSYEYRKLWDPTVIEALKIIDSK